MTAHAKRAQPKIKQSLKCPTCDFQTKESYYAKQELGRHLKFTHGVEGASSSAKIMQVKKQRTYKKRLTNAEKADLAAGKTERLLNGEAIALITTGKIIAFLEAEAERYGVPKNAFTLKVSQLLFSSQVRS